MSWGDLTKRSCVFHRFFWWRQVKNLVFSSARIKGALDADAPLEQRSKSNESELSGLGFRVVEAGFGVVLGWFRLVACHTADLAD